MTWERPTEDDMTHCAGCGSIDCDSQCEAYRKLEEQAFIDESQGVYLPAYCAVMDEAVCVKCGATLANGLDSVACETCFVKFNKGV